MAEIHELSAVQLSRAYARGELSPVQAVEAALARIARWEPRLNAMYRVHREAALEQARASAARLRTTCASRRRCATTWR